MAKKELTYKDGGVDIDAGNEAVVLIKDKVTGTHKYFPGKVLVAIGGFAAVLELENGTILVTSTDGVGTKLRTAFISGLHHKVGIDLVAMTLNDILVYGATEGFFLDYIAQGKQIPDRTDSILTGIVDGCHQAGFPLVGGEMAELPGFYKLEEYDLAAFGVGILPNRDHLITGEKIKHGCYAYGLTSNGLHSNGFSLIWKVFGIDFNNPEQAKQILNTYHPELGRTLLEEISTPTKLYQNDIRMLKVKYEVAGMANITGGGLVENPQRILPAGCSVKIKRGTWPIPPIFYLIQRRGNINQTEMLRTFNMGIGFIVYSPDKIKEDNIYKIGEVIPGNGEVIFEEA